VPFQTDIRKDGSVMAKGIDTDPNGFTMPDGQRFGWHDEGVDVDIEITATITLPDGRTMTINGTLNDAPDILIELLNKTCFPLDS
jgi:hypothetical protein